MKAVFLSFCFTTLVVAAPSGGGSTGSETRIQTLEKTVADLAMQLKLQKKTITDLGRQVMLEHLFLEERIRSDGDSGVKQIRHHRSGTRPYYSASHTGNGVLSAHTHVNYDRTVGLGEFIAVMNGVEFRTRHNDYKLRMPSRNSTAYHELEDIPFPDVPHRVQNQPTVAEQITEMQEWFKAWAEQNDTVRRYKNFFKPVLCYLEGAWTQTASSIDEPFESDRHHIDATDWFDLQEKIRYTSYSGSKSILENYAYLPTTIINIENGIPQYAQWNYRILCHPIKEDISLSAFKPVDELSSRLPFQRTLDYHLQSKAARFSLSSLKEDGFETYGLLDKIMSEIPGKDNYPGNLTENSFGSIARPLYKGGSSVLNAAYYHRKYKVDDKGAMGLKSITRGFAEDNLFFAKTTQPNVVSMSIKDCHVPPHTSKPVCTTYSGKYTYAIPLEIIYLTPLSNWNPYNIKFKGSYRSSEGATVSRHGRKGGFTQSTAYDGNSNKFFYHTPAGFFHGGEVGRDPADTAKDEVGVLNQHNNVVRVVASGTRILFPNITGIGFLRQRYPIMPVHGEGSGVWKEVDALKDMMMHVKRYNNYFVERPFSVNNKSTPANRVHFTTSSTSQDPPGPHRHDVFFNSEEITLMQKLAVTTYTSEDNGHFHELEVTFNTTIGQYVINLCDSQPVCWDGHSSVLYNLNSV